MNGKRIVDSFESNANVDHNNDDDGDDDEEDDVLASITTMN